MFRMIVMAVKVLKFTNWYLEEYEIPRRRLQRHLANQQKLKPLTVTSWITESEYAELNRIGAIEILKRGEHTRELGES